MLFIGSSTIIKFITNFTCVVKEIEIKYGNEKIVYVFNATKWKEWKKMTIQGQLQLVVFFVNVLKQKTYMAMIIMVID
jgi:hypothetical protein